MEVLTPLLCKHLFPRCYVPPGTSVRLSASYLPILGNSRPCLFRTFFMQAFSLLMQGILIASCKLIHDASLVFAIYILLDCSSPSTFPHFLPLINTIILPLTLSYLYPLPDIPCSSPSSLHLCYSLLILPIGYGYLFNLCGDFSSLFFPSPITPLVNMHKKSS